MRWKFFSSPLVLSFGTEAINTASTLDGKRSFRWCHSAAVPYGIRGWAIRSAPRQKLFDRCPASPASPDPPPGSRLPSFCRLDSVYNLARATPQHRESPPHAPPPAGPLQPHVLRPRPRAPVHGHGEHEAQGPERVSREGARCRLARAPLLRLQGRPRRCAGSLGPPDARVRWPEGGGGSVKGPDAPNCLPPAPADATPASSLVCLRDDENNSVGASQ